MIPRRVFSGLLIVALLGAGAACGPTSPEDLLAEARAAVEAGELRTAEIHLKNLLQQAPEHPDARRLLGEVSLAQGNAVGAEQDLRRARERGAAAADVHMPLLSALIAQGKFAEAVAEIESGPPVDGDDRVAELGLAGAAYRGLGRLADAERAYREALELRPQSADLRTALARVLFEGDRIDEGMRIVADLLAVQPEHVPALLLRGTVELQGGRYAAAETTFQTAVELAARDSGNALHELALAQLIESQLVQRKIAEASANADALLAAAPGAAISRYLKARVEAEQGDTESAERRLEGVIADFPEFWQAHALLGAINLDQEQLGQARMYLQTVVTNRPEDVTARLRLAELYVREGKIEDAKALIAGEDDNAASDALFYALIGRASLASGEAERAAEYFEQSEQASTSSVAELVGLSGLYVGAGEFERAIRVIEGAADGQEGLRNYLLALVRMRQGDLDGAAAAAEALSEEMPASAGPLTLRGAVALGGGQIAVARDFFARALELEPDNVPALLQAARAAALDDDRSEAERHLRHVLELEPGHGGAGLTLAALAVGDRDFAAARALLERVPASRQRALLEAEIALGEGRFADAAAGYKRAYAAQPSQQLALRAYAAASRAGLAQPEAELERWSDANPGDVTAAFALSSIALERGEAAEATRRLETVVAADPSHAAALNNLAWLYGEAGDARAEATARRALAAQPENAAIADTLGWILVRAGKSQEGLPHLERAAAALGGQHEVAYHFGVALDETGDAARALQVLKAALDAGAEFPGRDDAERRIARLEGR